MKKQYYKKVKIRKYTNNKYYDVYFLFFIIKTSIYLNILFYLATKL